MEKIKDFLAGKKTYLVMLGGIISTIIAWSTGEITFAQALPLFFGSAGFGALRAGIKKDGSK